MSNIDEARAQLEEGLFDSDSSNDDDSQKSSSSDEESDDDDTSSSVNLKPALKKGDRVVAAWWDLSRNEGVNSTDGKWFSGKVHAVKERDRYSGSRASKYGPIRIYDIHYDDGDELEGILDVFVCPEKDHELENNTNSRDWKGVRNVKDRASSDRYTKEIGWYVAIIDGEEKSFSTLYEAMKKSDEYTIKVKKGGVRKSDLNLPNEWKLPNKKKRGRPKKVNKEEDNPVKKKKKPDMKEIFDDTGSDSDDDMEDIRESSGADRVESLPVVGEPNYTGVYTSTKIGVYRSLFQDKNHVQKSAGVYMLKADAAHARDECCKELEGLLRKGPNFNTLEEYKIARDREMEARGISLKEVGTLPEMTAQIQEKRNEHGESHGESRQRSNDENEGESADDESLASDQVESLPGVGEPNYTGAVKSHKSGVYRSLIYEKNNGVWGQKSAGVYTLKADAAHARDECSRELGGFPAKGGPNFNTVEEYKIARAREIEARGLSLKEVGTLSEMSAQIQEKRNEHGESRQRSNDENEGESADESLAADQDKDEESVDVGSKLSGKGEETKYTGVSFISRIDRYRGFNWYNNKSNSLGEFVLAADAAHSRDEFCRVMNVTNKRGFNFSTEEEYKRARTMEINRRGLSLDKAGSSTGILAKTQARRTKWIESRQRNDDEDDSSQSSSDDLPLIAMKTKRRRSASPKETVVKTSSDYRGVKYNQRKEKHWTVSIFYNGKDRFVGVYDLETDAARVHDEVAAILVSNDDPNFATKSDHEQARKREAETLGLNLEMIDSFQASMEKAQIYVNSLLSGAEHVAQGVPRKTRSASPFTPILSDCEMRSEASPVENVKGSSRKIADLNKAMTMKWGRRLPAAGSLFIDSYQQNLCEMLGGVVDESSKTPIGTFVSICTVQSADGQEEHDRDLDGGESTHDSPRNIDMKKLSDFGDKLSGGQVENNIDKGIVEKEKPVERHGNLVEAGHDNQDEVPLEKNKPVERHDNLIVAGHDNQDEGILEKTKPDERHEILVGADYDNQGAEKVDLSEDVKKKEVKYTGISKRKGSNRYRGQAWYNGKISSMGDFVLSVDAAHSRDVFCRSFGLNKPLNFNTQEEYEQARATEIEQRGLTLDAADTLAKQKEVTLLSKVATRIKDKKAKWDAESKKSNSDAPVPREKKSQSKQTTQDDSDDDISLFSEANDEQEVFAQSQDSAAITVAASNVTAAAVKPKLSELNLVSVTKEQEESLDFPIGCQVLWKLQDESFHRGVVALAWLNMTQTISLVYEVEPLSGESKQMKCASELAFDTHCPVYIKSSPTDNNPLVEGEVLLSRTDGKKTLYTILVKTEGNEFQLKHDVPSDLVGFRKITNKNTSSSRRVTDVSEPNNQDLHSEQKPRPKTNSSKEAQPKRVNSPEKEVNGHCDMSISTSNSTISTRDSGRMSTPRGRSGNRNGTIWDGRSIDIELPKWLVSDNAVKDHLRYHLTGSPRGRKTIFAQIYGKTNCTLKMPSHDTNVIRIETTPGKFAIESLRKAKIELENIFLDYLNHDGCIGRLFYDFASSCQYLHPQRGRTCVYQRNPWQPNEMGYMTVVEVPCSHDDNKSHTFHLLSKKSRTLSRVRSVGCTINIVDKRGRVKTNWVACKPYVWVWGHKPGDVDDAVQILNDANREHMKTCGCHLPR